MWSISSSICSKNYKLYFLQKQPSGESTLGGCFLSRKVYFFNENLRWLVVRETNILPIESTT